jgi:hypothetical protein
MAAPGPGLHRGTPVGRLAGHDEKRRRPSRARYDHYFPDRRLCRDQRIAGGWNRRRRGRDRRADSGDHSAGLLRFPCRDRSGALLRSVRARARSRRSMPAGILIAKRPTPKAFRPAICQSAAWVPNIRLRSPRMDARPSSPVSWRESKPFDNWFDKGVDTPGIVLIKVKATRATYWRGREEGEVDL